MVNASIARGKIVDRRQASTAFRASGTSRLVPQRKGDTVVQQFLNQLLAFLQQGISAIFRFVQMIWTWSVGQISRVLDSPWQSWPLWKQVLLLIVVAAVVYALYKAGIELFEAGERTLAAFAGLLGALVKTLPQVVLAGLIALGGVWLLNNFDPSAVRIPTAFKSSSR
jgi:ABC-type proline/glycine betaine transport system permease subunit